MSSSLRSPPRLSDSPGRSIGESLLIYDLDERAAHFVRPLELKPVSCAFQDLESIVPNHLSRGALSLQTTEGGILVAPQEHGGRSDLHVARQRRPPGSGHQVGAVIVEPDVESTRSRHRADEQLNQRAWHRYRVGAH